MSTANRQRPARQPLTDLFCVNSRTGQAVRATPNVWWRTHVAAVGAQYDDPTSWHWETRDDDPTPPLLRHPVTLSNAKRFDAEAYGRMAIAAIQFHVATGQLAELDAAKHYTRQAVRRAEGR